MKGHSRCGNALWPRAQAQTQRRGDERVRMAQLGWLFGLIFAGAIAPLRAQDLEAGKTPAQLFASNCSACHRSPAGLAKGREPGLVGFLRQHYTTSAASAAALASFLAAAGAGGARAGQAALGNGRPPGPKPHAGARSRAGQPITVRGRQEQRQEPRQEPLSKPGRDIRPPGLASRPPRAVATKRGAATVSTDPRPVTISDAPGAVAPHPSPVPMPPPLPPARAAEPHAGLRREIPADAMGAGAPSGGGEGAVSDHGARGAAASSAPAPPPDIASPAHAGGDAARSERPDAALAPAAETAGPDAAPGAQSIFASPLP